MTLDEQLSVQYDILGHGLQEGFTEFRQFVKDGVIRRAYVKNKEAFIQKAKEKIALKEDLYVGINPRKKQSGMGVDVDYITCIVIDIDPVNPTGEGSSEEQHKLAGELGRRISIDFPESVLASSGSGYHVYLPLDPIKLSDSDQNRKEAENKTKAFGESLIAKYSTTELRIDSIFDLPRVIRVWGSINNKSNRVCELSGTWNGKRISLYEQKVDPAPSKVQEPAKAPTIVTGGRNNSLFKLACSLAKKGFDVGTITASLEGVNQKECHPPLSAREISSIAYSASKYKESQPGDAVEAKPISGNYFDTLDLRKRGISTGIPTLDEMISGLKKQKLIIMAARPSQGKTTVAMQIATNVALAGHRALIYPTESGQEPCIDKIVSRLAKVNLRKFQDGDFNEQERQAIDKVKGVVTELPIFIVEDFSLNADKIEEGIVKYKPDVVFIDYIQAFGWKDPDSVGEKNDTISRIKEFTIKYDIPIVLFSQLNRSDMGKRDLRMLKGAGALEERGDVVMFIETTDRLKYPRRAEFDILKSKYSQTGIIKMLYWSSICNFEEEEVPF